MFFVANFVMYRSSSCLLRDFLLYWCIFPSRVLPKQIKEPRRSHGTWVSTFNDTEAVVELILVWTPGPAKLTSLPFFPDANFCFFSETKNVLFLPARSTPSPANHTKTPATVGDAIARRGFPYGSFVMDPYGGVLGLASGVRSAGCKVSVR